MKCRSCLQKVTLSQTNNIIIIITCIITVITINIIIIIIIIMIITIIFIIIIIFSFSFYMPYPFCTSPIKCQVLPVSRPWRHWSWGKDVSLLTELWVICGLFQGDRLIFWSSQMLALPYVMAPVNNFFQSLLYNTSDEALMTIWYHFCLHDPVIPRSLYLSTVSQKP